MEIIIFIAYLLLVFFLLSFISFFKKSGLTTRELFFLFTIKVIAGVAYAKFYTLPKYYPGSDTWRFYRLSLIETNWLLHAPLGFLKDLFSYSYSKPGNIFSGQNTYWNDLKSNIIIKMLAVTNVLTHNSYYTNIILFNFFFLFGLVALFRLFSSVYSSQKWLIIVGVFLLPSALFWCSGVHKDGLILSATGIIIYVFYKALQFRFTIKKIAILLLCFLLLFALRNYVLFALLPALFCWWLCARFAIKPLKVFAGVYIIGIAALFIVPPIFHPLNFPAVLAEKQQEFLLLEGSSQVNVPPLHPTFFNYIQFFPYAADMAFLRPHITEFRNLSYLPAIAETVIFIALVIISLIFSNKKRPLLPVEFFLIFFSVSVLLICGYTIPFTGALVRYRSFILPLFITPLLCTLSLKFKRH